MRSALVSVLLGFLAHVNRIRGAGYTDLQPLPYPFTNSKMNAMQNNPLPLFIDTPTEWLENLFDRASIFMAMQCRENLKIVAKEIFNAYVWLVGMNDPIAFEFSPLMATIDRALFIATFD